MWLGNPTVWETHIFEVCHILTHGWLLPSQHCCLIIITYLNSDNATLNLAIRTVFLFCSYQQMIVFVMKKLTLMYFLFVTHCKYLLIIHRRHVERFYIFV